MSDHLRVLFLNNSSTERCGVRVYGELWIDALRKAGVEVDVCDVTYSAIYARGWYLPATDSYDLIHLNWDPQATNHFLPEHFPADVPLSVFLHDVPPNSTCPVFERADLRIAHEPGEGIVVIDHAVPDYLPTSKPSDAITVGLSGIRSDPGFPLVVEAAKRLGLVVSTPPWWNEGAWLTTEQEIERLARCAFNVCWYHTSGRGKSMSAMFACAAQRPLILSGSSMFSALWPYEDEVLILRHTHEDKLPTFLYSTGLDLAMETVALAARTGFYLAPRRVCEELSWSRCAQHIKALWAGVAR